MSAHNPYDVPMLVRQATETAPSAPSYRDPGRKSMAQIEAMEGRPLTWQERLGFWWSGMTSPRGRAASTDYDSSMFAGGFPLTGRVADAIHDTAPGRLGADIAGNVIDTAQGAAAVAAAITRPGSVLVLLGVLAGLAWWKWGGK